MVLVRVGYDERLDLVNLLLNRTKVRENQVHAWLTGGREKHTTVDDEHLILVLKDGHVSTDLGNTAQGIDTQRVLLLLRRLRQTLGQIRALHGLRYIATAAVVVAIAVVTTTVVVIAVVVVVVAAAAATTAATGTTRTGTTVAVVRASRLLRGCTGSSRFLRRLENRRSRLIRGGLGLRRRTRLTGHLAGTVTGFSHS